LSAIEKAESRANFKRSRRINSFTINLRARRRKLRESQKKRKKKKKKKKGRSLRRIWRR